MLPRGLFEQSLSLLSAPAAKGEIGAQQQCLHFRQRLGGARVERSRRWNIEFDAPKSLEMRRQIAHGACKIATERRAECLIRLMPIREKLNELRQGIAILGRQV